MADLNPLGSEKLQGDAKLKRILELTYFGEKSINESTKTYEFITEGNNGVYGIVKEKDGYYVKKGLTEGTLDYIGGMFMKNKNKFRSYAEALKRLDLLKGQEELQEATKYVLKNKSASPAEEAPAPPVDEVPAPVEEPMASEMPAEDMPSPDMGEPAPEEMGMEDMPSDDMGMGDEMGDEESKRSDYMAEIQKFAGKLGQELRDQKDRMESDDIKYVLNMVISAVDLDKLDDEDIEEIGKKFDRDEEDFEEPELMDGEDAEDMGGEEPEMPEDDLAEIEDFNMDALESFINTPAYQEEEIDLSQYADLGEEDEIKEFDLDEIKNDISKSIGETLGKYFK